MKKHPLKKCKAPFTGFAVGFADTSQISAVADHVTFDSDSIIFALGADAR